MAFTKCFADSMQKESSFHRHGDPTGNLDGKQALVGATRLRSL
jgi:hypothetical protein